MEKLKLNLNELKVQSFEINETKLEKGTVKANGTGGGGLGDPYYDSDVVTCNHSCGGTCNNTACIDDTCYHCGSAGVCDPTYTCMPCYPDTNPQDPGNPL